jgi:hypothetical protein
MINLASAKTPCRGSWLAQTWATVHPQIHPAADRGPLGAIVTVWPTTCWSRQHSARRLARWNDVLPPCPYIRSIASRALSPA